MMPIDQRTRQLCREKKVKVYGLALWRTVLNKKGEGRVVRGGQVVPRLTTTPCLGGPPGVDGAVRSRWGSEKSMG